jgi:hypothetical protein
METIHDLPSELEASAGQSGMMGRLAPHPAESAQPVVLEDEAEDSQRPHATERNFG